MTIELTPFEEDVLEQPEALRRLASTPLPEGFDKVVSSEWDRIIFTGMGSSHYAGVPTWRVACETGRTAWAIDTGQLLDTPGLVTDATLIIATSQSGASGEVVELLNRLQSRRMKRGMLVGVTDDLASPLASQSDITLPLYSGPEATVSTKSYLNTLGVHSRIAGAFAGYDDAMTVEYIVGAADAVRHVIESVDLAEVANRAFGESGSRIVMVGRDNDGATAKYAALITKEASKVAAEGFVGGQFRHGPFELAGKGLTALLFGLGRDRPDHSLKRLAADLVATGSTVVIVSRDSLPGTVSVTVGAASDVEALATGAVAAQLFAVALARANGVTPGSFAYGSKVTTAL